MVIIIWLVQIVKAFRVLVPEPQECIAITLPCPSSKNRLNGVVAKSQLRNANLHGECKLICCRVEESLHILERCQYDSGSASGVKCISAWVIVNFFAAREGCPSGRREKPEEDRLLRGRTDPSCKLSNIFQATTQAVVP